MQITPFNHLNGPHIKATCFFVIFYKLFVTLYNSVMASSRRSTVYNVVSNLSLIHGWRDGISVQYGMSYYTVLTPTKGRYIKSQEQHHYHHNKKDVPRTRTPHSTALSHKRISIIIMKGMTDRKKMVDSKPRNCGYCELHQLLQGTHTLLYDYFIAD